MIVAEIMLLLMLLLLLVLVLLLLLLLMVIMKIMMIVIRIIKMQHMLIITRTALLGTIKITVAAMMIKIIRKIMKRLLMAIVTA